MSDQDSWIYEHKDWRGDYRTGIQLDPSGSGYVPTHWRRVLTKRMNDE